MKIRTGFVSNSSSSSFVCDVCGNIESGWDLGLNDAEMCECVNGHTFCQSHMLPEFDIDDNEEGVYNIPTKFCPICSLEVLSDDDMVKYLLIKYNLNHDSILKDVKKRFKTYDYFKKFLKSK